MGEGNGSTKVGRWLGTLLPVVREGGPITLLLMLVLCGITLYYLNGQLSRQQATTTELVHLLLAEKDARVRDAITCNQGFRVPMGKPGEKIQ